MYVTIALIIWLIIGYFIGETTIHFQRKTLFKQSSKIHILEEKIDRYEKYVPITEIKKPQIIELHKRGINGREIWRILKIDGSAINRALHRWNII